MNDNTELRKLQDIIDNQADRILDLEAALDECKAQLESNTVVMMGGSARIEALEFEVEHERYNVEKTAQEAVERIKVLEAALKEAGEMWIRKDNRIEALEVALLAALRERMPSQEAIVKALLGNAVFANSFGTQHNAKLLARHLGDLIRALAPEQDK